MVLTTHEHPDHQGNLVRLAGESVARKAWFNPGQLPPSPVALMLAWGNQPIPAARVRADGPMAVAPGVVVIPAPSHTPGSQMVYVRLASGQELLFAGDIASLEQNWRDLRARSRLIGDHFAPEDRRAVFSWLKTIQQLRRESPVLVVIPGHDWHTVQTNPAFKPAISIGFSQQPAG
jgi:glyoxylase-like metal-dependent hydrolase (beta-lactamase superfamily II)